MITRWLTMVLVLTVALAACEAADDGPDVPGEASTELEANGADAAPPPGPPAGDAAGDDCAELTTHAHPDPVQLVRDYVERDAEGAFLGASEWLDSAMVCPYFVPGYDVISAIAGYEVGEPRSEGDTLLVPVTYHRLGEVSGDELEVDVREAAETFRLVETEHGWRIVAPPTWWQVRAGTVLERAPLDEPDRERLRSLLEERR